MRDELIITAERLKQLMVDTPVKLVDASWYLPNQDRSGRTEYLQQRLPGAVFFDIDAIADTDSGLPHTLASPAVFSERVGQLGIGISDTIVVYDGIGMFSSPRVAWNFRQMGAQGVRVLDGGLPLWIRAGGELENGIPDEPVPCRFDARPVDGLSVGLDTVARHLDASSAVVLDVRPAERFAGQAPEPRPGVRSGHMPGAVNVPFPELLIDGALASNEVLRARFEAAGVTPDSFVITSCGSGVTATIANLALECIGHPRHALYDGSWSEWGLSLIHI